MRHYKVSENLEKSVNVGGNEENQHQQNSETLISLSVVVRGCVSACVMGNLHICDSAINAERYIQDLEQDITPHPTYFSATSMQN